MTTLLILSLLAIVAVSYLSSMTAERQTAEAYSSKAAAEQAAQTGVDNATAMLAECFRDFPDSATVWDTTQTVNTGTPPAGVPVVNATNNEGTSLYLRAVSMPANGTTVANPLPHGNLTAADGNRFAAALAESPEPSGPGVVILPDIRGLYRFYVELAERLAAAGREVLALPDAEVLEEVP